MSQIHLLTIFCNFDHLLPSPCMALEPLLIHPPGHDSTVSIVYPGGPTIFTVRVSLPYVTLTWTSEDALVAAGHDCQPVLFQGSEAGWQAVGSLDEGSAGTKAGGGAARAGTPGRLNSAAFNTFRNAADRGLSSPGGAGSDAGDTELFTVHQNTITSVRPYEGAPGAVTRVSTSGVDGKLAIWEVSAVGALTGRVSGMRLG
jgi:actin related protein 2/3 complex subunit 1A/1B